MLGIVLCICSIYTYIFMVVEQTENTAGIKLIEYK